MESVQVRRTATGVFLFALAVAAAAAYVFLVFYENTLAFGAEWVTKMQLFEWVLFFSLFLVLAMVGLLVLYFLPRSEEAAPEAAASSEGDAASIAAAAPEAAGGTLMPEPAFIEEMVPVTAEADALLVKCTNCAHEFEIPYQTARPVYATCPKCGEEAVLEEGEEVLAAGGVPVLELEGIGPVFETKLREAGISTSEQLRRADAERVATQTGIAEGSIRNWQAQADFIRMDGVGKQLAELLALAGYTGLADLAAAKPDEVARRVKAYLRSVDAPPTKTGIDLKRARDFVRQAKKLKGT